MPLTIQDMQAAGFSDEEVGDWAKAQRAKGLAAGFTEQEMDNGLTGISMPNAVPKPFLDRITELKPKVSVGAEKEKKGFGEFVGALGESGKQLFDLFVNAANPENYLKSIEGFINPPQAENPATGKPLTQEQIQDQIPTPTNAAQFVAGHLLPGIHISSGAITRTVQGPLGDLHEQTVGGLPTNMDFVDAAKALSTGHVDAPIQNLPYVEQKLLELYKDHGIHPAEVVEDARIDPTIAQDMLSINPGLPEHYVGPDIARPPIEITVRESNRGAGGPPEPPRIEPPTIEGGEGPRRIEGPPTEEPPLTSEAALNKILDHLSIGEREPTRGWSFSRLYTNWVDEFNPIKLLTKEDKLPAELDPYVAYRELIASATKADAMLMRQGVWEYNAPEKGPTTRSLRDILEPVRTTAELDKFRAFASATHSIELERDGIATGFDQAAALKVVQDNMQKMQPILTELIDFQNKVSAWLRDSGIISNDAYNAMIDKRLIYVPFHRVLDGPLESSGKGGTKMASNPLRRIIGSERQVIDPLESIIKNTFLKVQMAERNYAAQQLVDFLEKKGEAPIVETGMIPAATPKDLADFAAWMEHYGQSKMVGDEFAAFIQSAATPIEGDGVISLFRDGKREFRQVDEDVARAIRGLDKEAVGNLLRFVGKWTNMLRAGSTLVPEFGGRHMMRDFQYAFITAKGMGFSPHWMVRGIMHHIKQDELFNQWIRSGGANVTYQAFDRQFLQHDLRVLTNETGLMTRSWNVIASPMLSVGQKAGIAFNAAIHPLQVITEIAQSASHIGAFERALSRDAGPLTREKLIQAGWESRETAVDISRRGAKMQAYNMISAFANATVQDTDRWIRAFKEYPTATSLKVFAGITAPSILLWAMNHDNPDYQELQSWDKDLFWHFPIGKIPPTAVAQAAGRDSSPWAFFRFPKPWGMGLLFGSGVERMLDALYAQKPEAFKGFFNQIWETNLPGIVPTIAQPPVEQWANKSFFTGRPIVPSSQEKILPEYQYNQYTTETAKSLGHLLGAFYPGGLMSPMNIEHYVQGWTGQLGKYVLSATDLALRKAGVVPDPPQPSSTLADIPVIRAFISRYPSATTASIEDFHEEFNRRSMIYHTWYTMAQQGDVAAMQHLQEIGGTAMFVRATGIEQSLATMQQLVRNVWRDPNMSPSDKRQLIDKTYGDMISMARIGNALMRAAK